MILLDTNVISELMRGVPDGTVMSWVNERPAATLFVSALSEAEVLYGIALMPDGRRKSGIAQAANRAFGEYFAGRVLPFDSAAAQVYATIAAKRRAAGRPIAPFDCQIAAIARSRRAAVATRNVADFEACEIELINPWKSQGRND